MKRIMIRTSGRKQYAYYLEVTEGNLVPKNAAVGLTGLEMNKSTMSSAVRDKLKKILLDNVLEPEQIDQRKLLTEIIKFEKEIYRSLMNKETKYYKPVTFKSMDAYTDPFALPPIKGAMVYNATKDEDLAPFDLHQRNSALLVKVKINGYNIEPLKDSNPKVYYALEKLLGKKEFKVKGILVYAIPYDTEIPDWLLDYIDYYTIINDVIKNFPLESVGLIGRAGNDSVNHSNILKIV